MNGLELMDFKSDAVTPTSISTIKKFLTDYTVLVSVGTCRSLPVR